MGKCKKFGDFKIDSQIREENFECFEERIYKVNMSGRLNCDDNVYLDEMDNCEIYAWVGLKNRINVCNV